MNTWQAIKKDSQTGIPICILFLFFLVVGIASIITWDEIENLKADKKISQDIAEGIRLKLYKDDQIEALKNWPSMSGTTNYLYRFHWYRIEPWRFLGPGEKKNGYWHI